MKKVLLLTLIIILCNTYTVSAAEWTTVEYYDNKIGMPTEPLLERSEEGGYIFNFRGEEYIIGTNNSQYGLPQRVSGSVPWSEGVYTIIKAGENYILRDKTDDEYWYYNDIPIHPIRLYDEKYNLICEHTFGKNVCEVGYFDNTYYCRLFGAEKNLKSADFKNWIVTEDEMPRQIGNLTYTNTTVSFDGKTLIDLNYEHNIGEKFFSTMGNWIVRGDEDNNFYLSNDNVYFVKITMPSEYSGESSKVINKNCDMRCIYEYDDNIIAEFGNLFCTYRLQAPKKDVYYNLDSYVSLPYVIYNDKILAFEQPPVIQDDRTLIPIRFLFEQMGATVDWDGETRTAAISQNDRTITFSINNTTATVNGQPAQMDVPARLIGGKTMVPLRFLSENLGYTVDWDGENRIITIDR